MSEGVHRRAVALAKSRPEYRPTPKDDTPPWEIPTPASERAAAGRRARDREDRRPVEGVMAPRPATVHRELTPQELQNIAEFSHGRVVRNPAEQDAWKRRDSYPTGTLWADRQGEERCRCGEGWPPCTVHLHRQHQRPYVRR
jgi:hypothetical protein